MLIDAIVISTIFAIFVGITWMDKHHFIGSILLLIVLATGIEYNKHTKSTEAPISMPNVCTPIVELPSQEQRT